MENRNLWAPWRSTYVGGEREPGCVFCKALSEPGNPERLVVAVGERAFAVMNRFPYSSGHLMVLPKRHTGRIEELGEGEVTEMWGLLVRAKAALTSLYNPDGFNVGVNIGEAAGAGITEHLHIHLVPRWSGDTNFMPVFADVRVLPHHLTQMREDIFKALTGS